MINRPATPTSIINALFVENERGFFILQRCKLCLQERKNKKDEQRSEGFNYTGTPPTQDQRG